MRLKKVLSTFKDNKRLAPIFNNRYALLATFCTCFIMLVVYFCYNLFPFGNTTILRMDLYHQYGPLFAELYEKVVNLDSFLYSWKSGGGGAFLGNFYNYLSSPFAFIMLLAGHDQMPEAIATMILLKSAIASFTFSYFISKKFGKQNPLVAAFGVLYACSGYFIAYYWNVMWLDAFYIFPLVMLGIEKIINNGKLKLYIIALTVTLVSNYYMGYMVCIFSVFYFIYTYFVGNSIVDTFYGRLKKREKGVKKFFGWLINNARNSIFIDRGVRFALGSLCAAFLAAFCLIPVYFTLLNCSATSGSFPSEFKTYFSIFDFLANHLAYLNPTIRSSGTDVFPNVYCGILTLILVPLYLFSNKISSKEKILSVALIGVMFASFYTNYLNFIWHGFHFPNDLPYRFSFMYSFILLLLAFKALMNIREYNNRQIIAAGTGLVAFVILVQEIGSKNFSEISVWVCVGFVGIYCLALGMLRNKRYPAVAAAALLLCSVCAEYTVANTNNYSMDQQKADYAGDYADFAKLKSTLDEKEGNDAYRMELTTLRTRMDPCWYYYNGMSTFSSMAYEKVANLQLHLGMFGNYINSYTYNRQTPVYNAFFALDYVVDNAAAPKAQMSDTLYKKLGSQGKFTAYENLYSLPIAFKVNNEMNTWSHDGDNPFEVQAALFDAATGINDVYNDMELDIVTGVGAESNYSAYGDSGCYPFSVTNVSNSSLTFRYNVKKSGNGYLYFKSGANNIKSITVTLPDGTVISQNIDGKAFILDLGELEAEGQVSVYAPITEGTSGFVYSYAVTLDNEEFQKGYDMLKTNAMNVTKFDETNIKGTVNADSDGVLYTSINYDLGWSVYIDGEKVSNDRILKIGNALLGTYITKGEHTVEFKYIPEGLVIGALITVMMLITLILAVSVSKMGFFVFEPEVYKEDDEQDGDDEENSQGDEIVELDAKTVEKAESEVPSDDCKPSEEDE